MRRDDQTMARLRANLGARLLAGEDPDRLLAATRLTLNIMADDGDLLAVPGYRLMLATEQCLLDWIDTRDRGCPGELVLGRGTSSSGPDT
jgi:hypothetical protein